MTFSPAALRWFAVSVFCLTSSLNYMDRQLLAALAPDIQKEFHLSLTGYGLIISAFSLAYAISSPLMGLLIDRIGLTMGASLTVGLWSVAGACTGLVNAFPALLGCRALLGVAEGGGIPSAAKAIAVYLEPKDRAFGSAVSQVGLTFGSIAAPLIAAWCSVRYGWRAAFVATGVCGLLWIPLWLSTSRTVPPRLPDRPAPSIALSGMLGTPAFWALIAVNILAMTAYSLWTNWTTLFFVKHQGLSQLDANRLFAWIPPVFASLGGIAGAWIAMRAIHAGIPVLEARLRICFWSATAALVTLAVPRMPSAAWAAAAISLSFFCTTAISVNVYSIPLDIFGAGRAAFGVSALTSSYGLMQTFLSPGIGWLLRAHGFEPVCLIVGVTPLCAVALLRLTIVAPARVVRAAA